MNYTNSMTQYLGSFVDELTRTGVKHVVISPGSRSTPVAILLEENKFITTYIHVDERSAAFFALGIAKALQEPVAILCTSGSASANYFPAIVEAYHSQIPLLVLTTDRPHELRDVGAPQAINQLNMYGNFVKEFIDLALPEASLQMFYYVRSTVVRAVEKSKVIPRGPIHINMPLREPLVPNLSIKNIWYSGKLNRPVHTSVLETSRKLSNVQEYVNLFYSNEKGIIICADGIGTNQENIVKFAKTFGYPILADPLSNMRSGQHDKEYIIESYDSILRSVNVKEYMKPDIIIRFGVAPVSKALNQYIGSNVDARIMLVENSDRWNDFTLVGAEKVICDIGNFCTDITEQLESDKSSDWLEQWQKLNQLVRIELKISPQMNSFFEGKVIQEIQANLPDDSIFYVSNSMPIRDVDSFYTVENKNIQILANRGANGIDGIVSTALGTSVANKPLLLLIGDLSFYHDLNGLLAAKLFEIDVTIVIINNDGGGIFSFLPQKKEEKHFEKLFGSPLGLDYEYVVKMYNGTFTRVTSWEQFSECVVNSFKEKGLKVIEINTNREENLNTHQSIWGNVNDKLSKLMDEFK